MLPRSATLDRRPLASRADSPNIAYIATSEQDGMIEFLPHRLFALRLQARGIDFQLRSSSSRRDASCRALSITPCRSSAVDFLPALDRPATVAARAASQRPNPSPALPTELRGTRFEPCLASVALSATSRFVAGQDAWDDADASGEARATDQAVASLRAASEWRTPRSPPFAPRERRRCSPNDSR